MKMYKHAFLQSYPPITLMVGCTCDRGWDAYELPPCPEHNPSFYGPYRTTTTIGDFPSIPPLRSMNTCKKSEIAVRRLQQAVLPLDIPA